MSARARTLGLCATAAIAMAGCDAPAPPIDPDAAPGFVGTAVCGECHDDAVRQWQGSHHALAMQPANSDTVLGDFAGVETRYFDETARFLTDDDRFIVETLDAGGETTAYPIAYTFGVEPIQQYLVEFPGGRLQALPWLWDTRPPEAGGQRWLHLYPDRYIAPDDVLHWTGRRQNWNYMCAECHSTNVVQAYDAGTDTFATRYDEISVGCEACHGPGSTHVAEANRGQFSANAGLAVDLNDQDGSVWAMNPETGIAARSPAALRPPQQPEACGRCHARRGTLLEPYEYGQSLADTHAVAHLDEGLYFPDGQIFEEVYVYGSFVQSRMYQAGVTCTNCHDPHSSNLITGPDPNAVCAQCHAPGVFAVPSHAMHEPADAGCVDCHMTARTYMVVDDRRDHSFRIPRPDLDDTGSPNACTTCHADQTAAWAAEAIDSFADRPPRPSAARAIASGRDGHANALLRSVVDERQYPGLVRATAIELFRAPLQPEDVTAILGGLGDADPQIRIASVRALRGFPPGETVRFAADVLSDQVRSVRIEAAITFAAMFEALDPTARTAFNRAAADFRRSRMLSASQSEALVSLADFEARLGNTAQARAAFDRALYVEPGFSVTRVNYADFLRAIGDEAGAESLLREGLAINDDDGALHHALGLLLVRTDRADSALDSLERAAALEPDNARYRYVYGVALNSLGNAEAALREMAAGHEAHPGNFDIAWAYATMLRDQGELEPARDVLESMAERYPGNRDVLRFLGELR